ncbi:sigma-70 family RNA polymerase sigma factor [Candidatus Poribacteria bacterium]
MLEDDLLVQKCLDGDKDAFGALVDKYKNAVHGLAYSKVHNLHDAEDIAQEAFINAYRNLRSLKYPHRFRSWIYAIVANLCRTWLREKPRSPLALASMNESESRENLEDRAIRESRKGQVLDRVLDAINELPETNRLVMTLYYIDGLTCKEIGEFTGTSINTVMSKLRRARSKLRKEFGEMPAQTITQRSVHSSFTAGILRAIENLSPVPQSPTNPFSRIMQIPWAVGLIICLMVITALHTGPLGGIYNAEKAAGEVIEQGREAEHFGKDDSYYQLELVSAYQPEERRKREQEGHLYTRFGGLGIRILSSPDGFVMIVQPLDGTPAMKAGLRSGDKIIEIDGESIKGKSLGQVANALRGEVGTEITITIQRLGRDAPFPVTITRDVITNPSMTSIMMEDQIGYIALSRLTKETPSELEQALSVLKGEDMRALVLDLRNNPGGELNSAVAVADAFLGEGIIVSAERGESNTQHSATGDVLYPAGMPLAILVNENSVSGAEIVAGAIKDHERGVIVGERTFSGAATYNEKAAIMYKTPNGNLIHKKGIEPHIEVEFPDILKEADDDMLAHLYKDEYIDKLVHEYLEKNRDQSAREQLHSLEAKVPELMKTLAGDEIQLSEEIITWYIRRTFAGIRNIPNIDLENDPQLATAINVLET